MSKFIEQMFAHNEFAHCDQILWAIFLGSEQFFCRCQQQDNHAGQSSFKPARHAQAEMVSPPAARIFPHLQFTTYGRTFQRSYYSGTSRYAIGVGRWGKMWYCMHVCVLAIVAAVQLLTFNFQFCVLGVQKYLFCTVYLQYYGQNTMGILGNMGIILDLPLWRRTDRVDTVAVPQVLVLIEHPIVAPMMLETWGWL